MNDTKPCLPGCLERCTDMEGGFPCEHQRNMHTHTHVPACPNSDPRGPCSHGQLRRACYTCEMEEQIANLRAELATAKGAREKAEARVQSLLMRHNANHGDGASVTCFDCIEARAILACQKEESK